MLCVRTCRQRIHTHVHPRPGREGAKVYRGTAFGFLDDLNQAQQELFNSTMEKILPP
jgi:hypothetical protein